MQAVKIGAAIDARQHRLAFDHEGGIPVTQRGLRDQRKPVGPVVAVAGEQPHALCIVDTI
jgi:hypothetical protein